MQPHCWKRSNDETAILAWTTTHTGAVGEGRDNNEMIGMFFSLFVFFSSFKLLYLNAATLLETKQRRDEDSLGDDTYRSSGRMRGGITMRQ